DATPLRERPSLTSRLLGRKLYGSSSKPSAASSNAMAKSSRSYEAPVVTEQHEPRQLPEAVADSEATSDMVLTGHRDSAPADSHPELSRPSISQVGIAG